MPAGTATSAARITATTTTRPLTRKRSHTSDSTGWPVLIDDPRSPCSMFENQMPNWAAQVWSSPSRARRSASAAGVARSPSSSWAGSPGIRRIITNTATATISSVGTAIKIRDSAKRSMARSSQFRRPATARTHRTDPALFIAQPAQRGSQEILHPRRTSGRRAARCPPGPAPRTPAASNERRRDSSRSGRVSPAEFARPACGTCRLRDA